MKVKVKWCEARDKVLNVMYSYPDKDYDIELEATPVEESRPWILCSSAANHDKAQKMGIECDCFKPKELKRLTNYYTIQHTDFLNQEIEQIYAAINELRGK